MKYIILCCVLTAVCIAAGVLITALIGRALKKRDRKLPRPVRGLLAAVFALALLCASFLGYLGVYYHADETALAALENGGGVTVTQENGVWYFDGPGSRAALVFYPGAKVEAEAYAPLMREIAERGVDCFLAEMPFRMAVFGSDIAEDIMSEYEYGDWYIGGHSLGGTAAAGFAADHPDEITGVILLASYPNESLDAGLNFFSVYGTDDGCLDREAYEESRRFWPLSAAESVLPGANHAQFGSYGAQRGDGEAEMPAEEQRELAAGQITGYIAAH